MRQVPAREEAKQVALSPSQQRVWYLQELTEQAGLLQVSRAFRLLGHLDVTALRRAIECVVDRHEVLHAGFRFDGDAIRESVFQEVSSALDVVDFEGQDDALVTELQRSARASLDLTSPPLVRCRLFRLSSEQHVMAVTAHLLVWDEKSFEVFIEELRQAYGAMVAGESPPEPLGPADDSASGASRQYFGAGELARRVEHWRAALADSPVVTTIPADFSRPAIPSYRTRTVSLELAPATVEAISAVEDRLQTHRSMILLAAYVVLLFRYTGQSDLLVGVKADGRRLLQTHDVVGPFEEVLPLRLTVGAHDSFETVVHRVQKATDSLLANQGVAFKTIVDACKVDRDASRAPLYQTMFDFDANRNYSGAFGAAQLRRFDLPTESSLLDLRLGLGPTDDGVALTLEYSTDLFVQQRIENLANHFENLVRSVADDSNRPVSDLPLMSPDELQQLLFGWNQTAQDWTDPTDTVAALIARHRGSHKTAVVDRAGHTSYADLVARASRYAARLRQMGVAPGDVVGLCMERSAELIVATLGCLLARAGYLPLDATLPVRRLTAMVEAAAAKIILTNEASRPRLSSLGVQLIATDSGEWLAGADTAPLSPGHGSDVAYVIFTSGSTGTPKGVRVLNSNVVNLVRGLAETIGPKESDRVLAHTTFSFDIHVLETLAVLSAHATLYLASAEEAEDAKVLAAIIERQDVTFLQCTPARWHQLDASGWRGKRTLKALAGGEAVSADVARFLRTSFGSAWNMYGPTETTVWSTFSEIAADGMPPIGRPIANTRLYLLDERGKPVPTGVPGELHIAGAGVADGYVGDPALTASRFLELTLAPGLSERAYKTGDLVRYDFDGRLHFIGRSDTQVKLRGFRLDLAEIEHAIGNLTSIQECAVVVSGAHEDARLVAFVVPRDGADFLVVAARKALREALPSYMLPQHYQVVSSLPLTRNGKLDRARLAAIGGAGAAASEHRTRPSTPTEVRVADLWRSMIGIDNVYAEDNFLDIGGHSLLSIAFIARWKRDTGVVLTPRDVVLNTLASIAKLSDEAVLRSERRL